jgi:alpha-glucosidase
MLPIIRDAIHLRYKLLPYLYQLSYESHVSGTPLIRPLFYEFQNDIKTFGIHFDFMLGPSLLVSNVTEPNTFEKRVYLPSIDDYWYDFWNHALFRGGQSVSLNVPLSQHGAVFVRHGSIIPMAKSMKFVGSESDDLRILAIFPSICQESQSITTTTTLYEDDGLSNNGNRYILLITMITTINLITLKLECYDQSFKPDYDKLILRFPETEKRRVECTSHFMIHVLEEYYILLK